MRAAPVTIEISLLGHLHAGSAGEQIGHGLRLRADEVDREIAGEERVGFGAGEGFLRVVLMFRGGPVSVEGH